MQGFSKQILKFMEGPDTRFVIPVYQRNYDWKLEHCAQLFDDLLSVIREGRPSHFFGCSTAARRLSLFMLRGCLFPMRLLQELHVF